MSTFSMEMLVLYWLYCELLVEEFGAELTDGVSLIALEDQNIDTEAQKFPA